ncbi:MAG: hypothetical protein ACPG7F_08360 [Aggregatilineales bacterium]
MRGHSTGTHQIAVLRWAKALMLEGVEVLLIGDSESGTVSVLALLDS